MHARQYASEKKKATDDWARRGRVQVPVSVVALRRSGREGEKCSGTRGESDGAKAFRTGRGQDTARPAPCRQ